MKKPVIFKCTGYFNDIHIELDYNAKNQRNNSEIPKSTKTKNKAITITVDTTTTVYFVSSLLFGQLVFLISEPTSEKKLVILLILITLRTHRFYMSHLL